jgi:hypothetical protein
VITNSALGAAKDQGSDLSADDGVVGEIIKPFDDFECFGEIASHSGTSLNLANSARVSPR